MGSLWVTDKGWQVRLAAWLSQPMQEIHAVPKAYRIYDGLPGHHVLFSGGAQCVIGAGRLSLERLARSQRCCRFESAVDSRLAVGIGV